MVVLSDVMEDLLEVFLGLVGQIGQILDPTKVNAGLALSRQNEYMNNVLRGGDVHLIYEIAVLPLGLIS